MPLEKLLVVRDSPKKKKMEKYEAFLFYDCLFSFLFTHYVQDMIVNYMRGQKCVLKFAQKCIFGPWNSLNLTLFIVVTS